MKEYLIILTKEAQDVLDDKPGIFKKFFRTKGARSYNSINDLPDYIESGLKKVGIKSEVEFRNNGKEISVKTKKELDEFVLLGFKGHPFIETVQEI
jgi:hypothetical protein